MKALSKMSKKELEEEYNIICQQIEEIDCFGMSDLKWRSAVENEIAIRGYSIRKTSSYKIEGGE